MVGKPFTLTRGSLRIQMETILVQVKQNQLGIYYSWMSQKGLLHLLHIISCFFFVS